MIALLAKLLPILEGILLLVGATLAFVSSLLKGVVAAHA